MYLQRKISKFTKDKTEQDLSLFIYIYYVFTMYLQYMKAMYLLSDKAV